LTGLETFWYWVNERHLIHLKRYSGEPFPWTEDPILRDFHFTEVFRQLDAGTKWLWNRLEKVKDDPGLSFFNILAYRFFNYEPTGEVLGIPITRWARPDNQYTLGFTSAHMTSSLGVKGILVVLDELWESRELWGKHIMESCSVEKTFYALLDIRGVGSFLAHQFAQDMRATCLLRDAVDGKDWAFPGPGARRGLSIVGLPETVSSMQTMYLEQDKFRAPHVPELEVKDIQQSLCEVQKYVKYRRMVLEGGPRVKFRKFNYAQKR